MNRARSIELSLPTARALAVLKQGLWRRPTTADKSVLLQMIQQIGLLQLDTINAVARSHYLVMLSRVGLYDCAWLDALLHPDRALFEQWAHAACLIPVEDYPYYAPVIQGRRKQPIDAWRGGRLGDEPQRVLQDVLEAVRQRGALASRDFADHRSERGSWWDHKPAKQALDLLYRQGYLMVDRRVNFQIYYDLAERVLPAASTAIAKSVDDYQRWALLKGLGCLGVATASQVCDYYRQKKGTVRSLLRPLQEEGEVLPVTVVGWDEQAYIRPDDLAWIERIEPGVGLSEVTTFLSPFDNLTWNRERLKALFDFDYRLEIYLPVAKRTYGYYVMPIFHRGRMVGRLDPKADRQSGSMIIRNIYLEPAETMDDALILGLQQALQEFMSFHGSRKLIIERSEPSKLRRTLLMAAP